MGKSLIKNLEYIEEKKNDSYRGINKAPGH